MLCNYAIKHAYLCGSHVADFGARPRKLFVVVNPVSGRGSGLHTWLEVEKLFELAEVEVEAVGELNSTDTNIRMYVCAVVLSCVTRW